MVAYGLPVIHPSLATAPLDIKEAIDWLIRIGGKDIKKGAGTKCGKLIEVLQATVQDECMVAIQQHYVNALPSNVNTLVEELATFLGYEDSTDHNGVNAIGINGIGRPSGQSVVADVSIKRFLYCCKAGNGDSCKSSCICCENGNVGGSNCNPNSCPIKALLENPITLVGLCGDEGNRPPNGNSNSAPVCCIISFLVACLKRGEEINNGSVKCRRCNDSKLHENCHKGCKCKHTKVTSKVACRINCLIQLAVTLNTLYINKDVPMCNVCRNCKMCGKKCLPCPKCNTALQSKGEHCVKCRRGECCSEEQDTKNLCQPQCQNCQTCSTVRNAKVFWLKLEKLLYCCAKCGQCNTQGIQEHLDDCSECTNCKGDSCEVGCINRKEFGLVVLELLHFMVYNFADVAYSLPGNIRAIKEECCKQRGKSTDCQCSEACCGSSTSGASHCEDCKAYCICCVDQGNGCSCSNDCAGKLELLLRPALSGYVSAYDYKTATWENLCKSDNNKKCSDQCTESCSCASSECPEEGCCSYCPKRMCAKTFCLIVPAIYSFFNYVNRHITDELRYGNVNPTSQWAGGLINGDAPLGELFRSSGFSSSRLKPRMGCDLMQNGNDGSSVLCKFNDHQPGNITPLLESLGKANDMVGMTLKLYNKQPTISVAYHKPETVREKLLWLSGLPYSDAYEELQQRLENSMPNGSSSLSMMELTLRLCVIPFHVIEDSSHCVWEYLTKGYNIPDNKFTLNYNPDTTRLSWDLYDALYDVTCALTFMNKQCSVSSIKNGWEQCRFGKSLSVYEGKSNGRCDCQDGKCRDNCDHCTSVCEACRPGARCVCCCPHCEHRPDNCICLMRFIASNDAQSDTSTASPFNNAIYGTMGFSRQRLRRGRMTGSALYNCMSGLLTKDHSVFPRLLQHLLIARAGIPDNVSDYYALFLGLGMRLELGSHDEGGRHKDLAKAFKSSMTNAFFGACETTMNQVVMALQRLNNQDHAREASSVIHRDSAHNTSDLMSLYGCYSGVGCVGYMYALSLATYQMDSSYAYNGISHSASLFINWVFCGATKFYIGMRQLAEDVSALECCRESVNCKCIAISSNICNCTDCECHCKIFGALCSCGTIIKCSKVHPLLYRFGFTFHEPDMWSSPKRRCKDFSDTLNRFLRRDSMLCQLIEAIENFLWHTRMPFSVGSMILWAAALCFLMYVFIGYLDRLRIRSRWLIPKQLAHPLQLVARTILKPLPGGNVML